MLIALIILISLVDTIIVAIRADEYGLLGAVNIYESSLLRTTELAIGESARSEIWRYCNRILCVFAFASNVNANMVTYYADLLCVCSALAFYMAAKMTFQGTCSATQVL